MSYDLKLTTPFIPFPNIAWWALVLQYPTVVFDEAEHFQKMSYRNRYYISGSNGLIQLTIPLSEGRNQRTVIKNVGIDNKDKWQVQHWRTLTSVYKRSPYFEFYEEDLKTLYTEEFTSLIGFNLASVHWLKHQLRLSYDEVIAADYIKEYPEGVTDIRQNMRPGIEKTNRTFPAYYQIFADRTGFLPNLSLLDLLFSEGPASLHWLTTNREAILSAAF